MGINQKVTKSKNESLMEIAHLAAKIYARKYLPRMTEDERALVSELEEQGFIVRKTRPDDFVGQASIPPGDEDNYSEDTHS